MYWSPERCQASATLPPSSLRTTASKVLYQGIGFRPYRRTYNDQHFGLMVPLVFIAGDGDYLRQVGSPLLGAVIDPAAPTSELARRVAGMLPSPPPVRSLERVRDYDWSAEIDTAASCSTGPARDTGRTPRSARSWETSHSCSGPTGPSTSSQARPARVLSLNEPALQTVMESHSRTAAILLLNLCRMLAGRVAAQS
jgi:hypothetical protein